MYITSIVNTIYSTGIILFKKVSFLILQQQEKKNTEIRDIRCGRAVLLTKDLGLKCIWQKQIFISVLRKRCAENLQQFYRRTLRNIEITLRHKCSLADLLQVFRTTFPKNIWRALLVWVCNDLWKSKVYLSVSPQAFFENIRVFRRLVVSFIFIPLTNLP